MKVVALYGTRGKRVRHLVGLYQEPAVAEAIGAGLEDYESYDTEELNVETSASVAEYQSNARLRQLSEVLTPDEIELLRQSGRL